MNALRKKLVIIKDITSELDFFGDKIQDYLLVTVSARKNNKAFCLENII